jgi:hypothetical protein
MEKDRAICKKGRQPSLLLKGWPYLRLTLSLSRKGWDQHSHYPRQVQVSIISSSNSLAWGSGAIQSSSLPLLRITAEPSLLAIPNEPLMRWKWIFSGGLTIAEELLSFKERSMLLVLPHFSAIAHVAQATVALALGFVWQVWCNHFSYHRMNWSCLYIGP